METTFGDTTVDLEAGYLILWLGNPNQTVVASKNPCKKEKGALMHKKIGMITLSILLPVVLIITLLCTIPCSFQETLTAIKIDSKGNRIGTAEISISGKKTNFFGNHKLRALSIDGFDGNPAMEDVDLSRASKKLTQDYFSITFGIATLDSGNGNITDFDKLNADSYTCTIAYSEDLDKWLIHIRTGSDPGVYYLFSFSGDHTTEELWEYFEIT